MLRRSTREASPPPPRSATSGQIAPTWPRSRPSSRAEASGRPRGRSLRLPRAPWRQRGCRQPGRQGEWGPYRMRCLMPLRPLSRHPSGREGLAARALARARADCITAGVGRSRARVCARCLRCWRRARRGDAGRRPCPGALRLGGCVLTRSDMREGCVCVCARHRGVSNEGVGTAQVACNQSASLALASLGRATRAEPEPPAPLTFGAVALRPIVAAQSLVQPERVHSTHLCTSTRLCSN